MPKAYNLSLTEQIAKTISTVNLLIGDLCTLEGMLKDLKDTTRQPEVHLQPQTSTKSTESIFLGSEENIKDFIVFVRGQKGESK